MTAAVQTLWAELLAATLGDAGVTTAVVSPGSRSTPLVAALAADGRFAMPTLIDERAAGFFALGMARTTGEPVALLCTSGTAAAHYFPAVIEAFHAGVPLVVVTADRPSEAQGAGAAQTIDQSKLYGDFVVGFWDTGTADGSTTSLRALRRKVVQAVSRCRGARQPVHLNVPLRKPLEPRAPSSESDRATAAVVAELRATPAMLATPTLSADHQSLDALAAAIRGKRRGLIVAGPAPSGPAGYRESAFDLARRSGYPLLAEATSQLRFVAARAGSPGGDGVVTCDGFPLAFAAPTPAALAPDLIIQIGGEPAALDWPRFLERHRGAERWVLPGPTWRDPDSSARAVIVGDLDDALARLAAAVEPGADPAWQAAWRDLDTAARRAAATEMADGASEHATMSAVVSALPADTTVLVANSLPVRVLDEACAGRGKTLAVQSQRGVNGIDGLVAGAAGAAATGRATVLLCGDVAFAHDVAGVAAMHLATAPLVVVIFDNGGGRIFDELPVATSGLGAETFQRHWTTPPVGDALAIAAAFGVDAVAAASPADAARAVATALSQRRPTVIRTAVAPHSAHAFRRAVATALGGAPANLR